MRVTTYTATLELKTEKANAHSAQISSVAYSPDGSQILTGSWDKSLKVWEWDSGGHRESVNGIIISYLIELTLIACHYLHSHAGAHG